VSRGQSEGRDSGVYPATPRELILYYFGKFRYRLAAGIALLLATNALALSIPRLLKTAIDSMETGTSARAIGLLAGGIGAIALAQSVVRIFSRMTILGMSRLVVYDLRRRLFSHLQRLPISFFNSRGTGDVVSRAINDVIQIRSFYGPGVMNFINTVLVYTGAIILMASMSPKLTLIALAPYPVFAIAVNLLSRRVYALSKAVQEGLGDLTNKAQENLSGMTLIKTYVREDAEAREFGSLGKSYLDRTLELAWARGLMMPLMGSMSHVGTIVVIFIGGGMMARGELGLGDFVAFNAYLAYLLWPTFAFGWIMNTFQRGLAAFGRLSEILSIPGEEREFLSGEAEALQKPFQGKLEFKDLSFAYPGAPEGKHQLMDISATIEPGEVVGILGTVGAGKSTLAKLIPRIHTPVRGTLFIDGQDVNDIHLARLRRHVSLVPQEAFLFSRSIRQNVAYAPRKFVEEQIMSAVEDARLAQDIPALPKGLETVVGERGFTLSGGQRQRATLARALITDASILILDDPLSSVDASVEEEMLTELRKRAKGRTVILISNRVAALAWCDRILVLENGSITDRGTHSELMNSDGLYASVAAQQSLNDSLSRM
jgi:ATP-binding cassette subfamily B multidrug efflux pump